MTSEAETSAPLSPSSEFWGVPHPCLWSSLDLLCFLKQHIALYLSCCVAFQGNPPSSRFPDSIDLILEFFAPEAPCLC